MAGVSRALFAVSLLWNPFRPRSITQADPTRPEAYPGDVFGVTDQYICVPGYAKKVRAVPAWLKRKVYAEYGITEYKTGITKSIT
jgi:hypothetical protein